MKKQLEQVAAFTTAFLRKVEDQPTNIEEEDFILRHKLMEEENDEYMHAAVAGNITEIADALGDMLYILCGTIVEHGMQYKIEEVFDEIHRSNMSKLADDGKPLLRNDGKILKGPNYFKPDLERILSSDGDSDRQRQMLDSIDPELLASVFLDQIVEDEYNQEFEAFDEMVRKLWEDPGNRNILFSYLGENAVERLRADTKKAEV